MRYFRPITTPNRQPPPSSLQPPTTTKCAFTNQPRVLDVRKQVCFQQPGLCRRWQLREGEGSPSHCACQARLCRLARDQAASAAALRQQRGGKRNINTQSHNHINTTSQNNTTTDTEPTTTATKLTWHTEQSRAVIYFWDIIGKQKPSHITHDSNNSSSGKTSTRTTRRAGIIFRHDSQAGLYEALLPSNISPCAMDVSRPRDNIIEDNSTQTHGPWALAPKASVGSRPGFESPMRLLATARHATRKILCVRCTVS